MSEEARQSDTLDLAVAAKLAATTLSLTTSGEANQAVLAPGGICPSIAEQILTGDLSGSFDYVPQESPREGNRRPGDNVHMSEAEGLNRLTGFITSFIDIASQSRDEQDVQLVKQAKDILENTNYVTEHQLSEATTWMANSWKQYLRENPSAELFLWAMENRSSAYVLHRTLQHFNDEERTEFAGRLQMFDELRPRWPKLETKQLPDRYKVIMIDDTIGTGRQLSNAYGQDIAVYWPYPEPPNVEVNLIIATQNMLEQGFTTNSSSYGVHLPVAAFYQARPAQQYDAITTFTHSSTDDRFEIPIGNMVQSLRTRHGQPDAMMPPLTNITRQYYRTPLGQVPETV